MFGFFKNLLQTLFYGGLTKEEYNRITSSITHDNRKTLLKMSYVSLCAFFIALILYPDMRAAPIFTYLISMTFLIVLIVMTTIFKNNEYIVDFGIYLFIVVLYSAGIYISAVVGVETLASTFMVFLIVIPLLFIIRPIIINFIVVAADAIFVFVLYMMQQEELLFASNKLNAIVYGILSIVIGTLMMKIKMENMNRLWKVRYLSETDQLTGLPNRRSYEHSLKELLNNKFENDYAIAAFDIDGLKHTNDNLGHAVGDELIKGAANCLQSCFAQYGKIFRTGGDEFVGIFSTENMDFEKTIADLEKATAEWKNEKIDSISISSGYALHKNFPNETIYELLKIADRRMYKAKSEHYKKQGFDRRHID